MKLKAEMTKVHYSVEVPREFLLKLMEGDRYGEENTVSDRLNKSLTGLGAEDIDWGGMFGPYVFFSASEEKYRTIEDIRDTAIQTIEVFIEETL
jgi:hypothetical protein